MLTRVSGSMDGAGAARADQADEVWTTRRLFAQHKAIGISAVVLLLALLAIIVGGILASSPVVISDSSTCSTWSSANQTQQQAYGQRYIREHGALPSGSTNPGSVVAAINAGCTQAFDNDAQDTATVVGAIKG
jgi:hypothetical protein